MPNRIVREGIIDSVRMDALVGDAGWPGEVFYRRLHSVVDDFGRFDGRASVLRAKCYPTMLERVREADVQRWIAACVKSGLVRLYTVDGKPFVEVLDFRQQLRAKKKRFPDPPATHTHSDSVAVVQRMLPESESESESESEIESNPKEDSSEPLFAASEPAAVALPAELPILEIPSVGKGLKLWPLTALKVAEWGEAYPGVDVVAECRKARQWCIDNPTKRKTFSGMPAFLSRWLTKAQNDLASGAKSGGRPSTRGEAQDNYAARRAATAFGVKK